MVAKSQEVVRGYRANRYNKSKSLAVLQSASTWAKIISF